MPNTSSLTGLATTDKKRCVIDAMGGTTHNYRYCVRPPPNADAYMTRGGPLTMENVGRVFNELSKYVEYLIIKPDTATRSECIEYTSNRPLLGNKYVLKTGLKCIPISKTTKSTLCKPDNTPMEKTMYKYINNVSDGSSFITGGGENPDGNGLIQSIAGNIGTLGTNIVNLATSFAAETKPYCMEAQVSCHIIHGRDSIYNYSGPSDSSGLFFSLSDLQEMTSDNFASGVKPDIPTNNQIINSCISGVSQFSNINNINNDDYIKNTITQNIINQNSDKFIYPSQFDSIIDTINNTTNFDDSVLVKTYYLGLSLLMLLIMFRLLYGKQLLKKY
jgi:hypothetical protein